MGRSDLHKPEKDQMTRFVVGLASKTTGRAGKESNRFCQVVWSVSAMSTIKGCELHTYEAVRVAVGNLEGYCQ